VLRGTLGFQDLRARNSMLASRFIGEVRNYAERLTQTASWGLAALQALTLGPSIERLPEAEQQTLRNLPARVFYGVNSDEAIALRLLGVPRGAAPSLASMLNWREPQASLQDVRATLARGDADLWRQALGSSGSDYFSVWNILEGNR